MSQSHNTANKCYNLLAQSISMFQTRAPTLTNYFIAIKELINYYLIYKTKQKLVHNCEILKLHNFTSTRN